VLTQCFRKSVIITRWDKSGIKRGNETDVRLKKTLHSLLRKKTLRVRDNGTGSSQSLVLSSPIVHKLAINSEDRVLRVILFYYQKLLGELCYQSIIIDYKGLKGRISSLYAVPGNSKEVQAR